MKRGFEFDSMTFLNTFPENYNEGFETALNKYEQQKPVIKITDHYFTDDEIIRLLKDSFLLPANIYEIGKDDVGFYYRVETEI